MERRLAAIMATDVVGYSRLIRADEEGTLEALKALRADLIDPKIAEHHGRIVKLMGDGMLVEFASVVDAVRAAVETQQAVVDHNSDVPADKRIELRIGINLGDVVIDGDDIQGDGVNVAARLEGMAEPGGICVSGMVYEGVRDRIDVPFEDLGNQEVKNIDRPVRVWRWISDTSPTPSPKTGSTALSLPDNPSIAVLPFENISNDPEQEYFADGITEDIITTLSKVPNLLVVARNSTFTYKGQAVDVKQVGTEQGVGYVLEGSIRKVGNRVRITAQLIDAITGLHVWADRYDHNFDNIFELQDEIALKVATQLQVELTEGEMARFRSSGTINVEAWSKQIRAVASTRRISKESFVEARRFAEQAARLDPDYSAPLCTLGFINTVEGRHGFSESRSASITKAREYATRALALDPHNPEAYGVLGFADFLEGNHEEALDKFNMALDINPNHADVTARLALTHTFNEQLDEGIIFAQRAMRLSPKYPGWYAGVYGFALRVAGRYDEAIEAFHEYGRLEKGFGHVDLAIVYVITDELETARREASEVLRHRPKFTISRWSETQLYANSERLRVDEEALRQAGLPE